jgi:hypothetical protein
MSDALLREWRGDPKRWVRVNVFGKNDAKLNLEYMQDDMTQNGLDDTGTKIDLQRRFLAHRQAEAASEAADEDTRKQALATAAAVLATADGFLD